MEVAELFPCSVIIIDNVSSVSNFFETLFNVQAKPMHHPCKHTVISVSEKASVVLIESNYCSQSVLTSVSLIAVRRVFFVVSELVEMEMKATSLGGQIIESKNDGSGGGFCTIEGPEGIMIHLSSVSRKKKYQPHELLMMALHITPDANDDDDEDLSAALSAKRFSMSHARPPIHTLDAHLQSDLSPFGLVPCPPNSRTPTAFETDLFKGVALLIVRTNPLDPHYRSFFPGKRTFEVQVQGKFKRMPRGEIYVGCDCPISMELGILTRSFCRVILQFVSTMVHDIHYSFGEPSSKENYEIAHLVAPIFAAMDKIIVSKPGEPIPEMGVPFVEDQEFRKFRLKTHSIKEINIDLNNTYSFSVNTHNWDLCSWNLVNIPMLRPMDVRTLAGDSPVRLVGYELADDIRKSCPDKHPSDKLKYLFSLKLTSIDPEKQVELPLDRSEEYDDMHLDDAIVPATNALNDASDEEEEDEPEPDSIKSNVKSDKKSLWRKLRPHHDGEKKKGVRTWIKRELGELFDHDEDATGATSDAFMETGEGDLKYCPMCIEVASDNKRRTMFLLPVALNMPASKDTSPKLRAYNDFFRIFDFHRYEKLSKNTRLSNIEKRRRQIILSYRAALSNTSSHNKLEEFLGSRSELDRTFLDQPPVVSRSSRNNKSLEKWEGLVALAVDKRHWIEKTLILNKNEMMILKHADARKSSGLTIATSAIFSIRVLSPNEVPVDCFAFFAVETFSCVLTFMVRSQTHLDAWISIFTNICGDKLTKSMNLRTYAMPNLVESDENLFAKPVGYKLEKKRVLNFRRIIFRKSGLAPQLRDMTPNALVESILDKALSLISSPVMDVLKWIDFMDSLSALQVLDISGLKEREKIALLLNLYHTMVLHGMLVLGSPASWSSWPSFFNTISYIICYDVISINELEHNCLRAAMAKPSSALLSKILVPPSVYCALRLQQRDFRLNFCINCGSRSIPGGIPIYRPDVLDRQMDEVTMEALAETSRIDADRKAIILPRICLWYLPDFSKRTAPLPEDCLRIIAPYMRQDDKIALAKILAEGGVPNIRFRPFAFRCRALTKLDI